MAGLGRRAGPGLAAEGAPDAVLTAANLRMAYNAESQIGRNPITGRPMLLAVRALRDSAAAPSPSSS